MTSTTDAREDSLLGPAQGEPESGEPGVHLALHFEQGTRETVYRRLPVTIGRDPACTLRLRSWRVARHHATLLPCEGGARLEDAGSLGGSWRQGRRITRSGLLAVGDEILIGPCLLRIVGYGAGLPPSADGAVPLHEAAASSPAEASPPVARAAVASQESTLAHRRRLHEALLQALDLRRQGHGEFSDADLRDEAGRVLTRLLAQDSWLPSHMDRDALRQAILDEALGLGVLEPLLADDDITEIMVNRHDELYVERSGRLSRHEAVFSSEQAVRGVIDRIVAPLGRRIDESEPMVDARLPDGSRLNAVIPPVALHGCCLTIRKFPRHRLGMADLVERGSLDVCMRDFLLACVRGRKNLIVSGGTGSGKTTLLNILSNGIPEGERIVTIEDAAELRLHHPHCIALEARPANLEGRGRITIRDLVRNALRMRPDRIVVGECRGGEAFDMLAAMNTGHEGSLGTLHANSPREALARLETMVLMAGMALPLTAVREHIAASVDIVVQQARRADGRRVVTAIVEITGMESGLIRLQELFRLDTQGVPTFVGCGTAPEGFLDERGVCRLPLAWFQQSHPAPWAVP